MTGASPADWGLYAEASCVPQPGPRVQAIMQYNSTNSSAKITIQDTHAWRTDDVKAKFRTEPYVQGRFQPWKAGGMQHRITATELSNLRLLTLNYN